MADEAGGAAGLNGLVVLRLTLLSTPLRTG